MSTTAANFSGVLREGCNNDGYDVLLEDFKYLCQLFYFIPGIAIHIRLLMIMLFRHRKIYMIQSFFIIFSMDSVASLTQIIIDTFIQRITIYIPQVCPILYDYFLSNRTFPNFYFSLYNYMRAAKSIIQIYLTLNRMTCVLMPLRYGQIWRAAMPITIAIIILSPFLVIWNVLISETFPAAMFGGFSLAYSKNVRWASLSLFQMTFMIIALVITIISTLITLLKMRMLENRLKSSERTLCFASFYMSAGFLAAALFQSYFAFFNVAAASTRLMYFLQGFSFDVLNIGSPIVMIVISGQLRYHFVPIKKLAPKISSGTFISVSKV